MSWFQLLFDKREEQLKVEEKIDHKLREAQKTCPCEVMTYMFQMRALNRKLVQKCNDTPWYSGYQEYTKNLEIVDNIQGPLAECPPKNICEALRRMNKDVEDVYNV
jgi:hypothetical protein